MWNPTALSFAFMAIIAAIYEPLRLALQYNITQFNMGGVGGVGGLANMLGAGDSNCDTNSANVHNSTFHDNYCYERGTPYTPFAWIMLMLWVGPLFIAMIAVVTTKYFMNRRAESISNTSESSASGLGIMAATWTGLNILWFVIPLSVFWFGLTNGVDGNSTALKILAAAIAASHPLSWNLMVASIPASGITTTLLGCDRQAMFQCHRFISYFTVGWGLAHGILELIYLSITRSSKTGRRKIFDELLLLEDGEDLMYLAGFFALLLILCQGLVAYCRRFLRENQWDFHKIHRGLAFALLIIAATHWWPFVIFLIPAIALHGVGIACYRLSLYQDDHNKSLCSLPDRLTRDRVTIAVTLSILSSFIITTCIWALRQVYMTSSVANLSVPFLFPFLCIPASLFSSTFISQVYLRSSVYGNPINEDASQDLNSPLLIDAESAEEETSIE